MLTLTQNVDYMAIHFAIPERTGRPTANVAVYTGNGNDWVFGLRKKVAIGVNAFPVAAHQAGLDLERLRRAIEALPPGTFTLTAWDRLPEALRTPFMAGGDAKFAPNYQWYLLRNSPEAIAAAAVHGLLR